MTTPSSSSSKKIPPRSHYPKSSNCWSNIDNAIFKNTDYENEKMKNYHLIDEKNEKIKKIIPACVIVAENNPGMLYF